MHIWHDFQAYRREARRLDRRLFHVLQVGSRRRWNEPAALSDLVTLWSCAALACMLSRMSCKKKLLRQYCTVKEALGILGVFGTLISVLQAWSLEWTRFVEVT